MPIIDHGTGAHVEYTIPPGIESRIPNYFYTALAGELFSVFGWERSRDLFYPTEENDCADLASSTAGWVTAFTAACKKLDMDWLVEYYRSLEWYDSDVFDGIIEQEIGRRFMKASNDGTNSYYRYLIEKEKN